MAEKNRMLSVVAPSTIEEWKRWCATKDMPYDKAKEWLAIQEHELSIDEWEQELFDFAQAINEHMDNGGRNKGSYIPQKREV